MSNKIAFKILQEHHKECTNGDERLGEEYMTLVTDSMESTIVEYCEDGNYRTWNIIDNSTGKVVWAGEPCELLDEFTKNLKK